MLTENVGEELGANQDGHQLVAVHVVLVYTSSTRTTKDKNETAYI